MEPNAPTTLNDRCTERWGVWSRSGYRVGPKWRGNGPRIRIECPPFRLGTLPRWHLGKEGLKRFAESGYIEAYRRNFVLLWQVMCVVENSRRHFVDNKHFVICFAKDKTLPMPKDTLQSRLVHFFSHDPTMMLGEKPQCAACWKKCDEKDLHTTLNK